MMTERLSAISNGSPGFMSGILRTNLCNGKRRELMSRRLMIPGECSGIEEIHGLDMDGDGRIG
jgi:hypothetical protein